MIKKFLAVCLLFSTTIVHAETIIAINAKELQTANSKAKPGDTILLKNGNWENIEIKLTCSGTEDQLIVFKAETNGQVFITGSSSLRIGGNHIIVEGLVFTDGSASSGHVWEFRKDKEVANNSRITNCIIKGFNPNNRMDDNHWVALYGKNNRVDHCNFIDKTNIGVLMAVMLDDDRSRLNSHSIDSNYFGFRKPLGSNGGEIIRVGVSQHCTFYSNTIIKNNFFEHCDGETEIISIKSCGNKVQDNVFKECQGAVVLRHGNNNTIEGNVFWGNGKEGTGGVRVINEGNWIVNNFFFKCVGKGFRSPLSVMNGVLNSPPNRYLPVKDAVIANNSFFNCTPFSLGEGSDTERTEAPKNVFFFNNLFYNNLDSNLFFSYCPIDGISFANNFFSNKLTSSSLKGFSQSKVSFKSWNGSSYPVLSKRSEQILPDSFKDQMNTRLKYPLPDKVGSGNITFFRSLINNADELGVTWKQPNTDQRTAVKAANCIDAAAVYAALTNDEATEISINLTGSSYLFTKPLTIAKPTHFNGRGRDLSFVSEYNILNFFEIKGNSSLILENMNVKLDSLAINQFISTNSSGSCNHFSIKIDDCKFSGSDLLAFYDGAKNSYADEIVVTNSVFREMQGPLFNLKDELDDKGFYNTERMVINNCLFENYKGPLLNIYRGGNDESTMGPKLIFNDNKILNSRNDFELIRLYGVQESMVSNNSFVNSNQLAPVIVYEDKVRADHQQKNNTLTNSGPIVENKFVINLKN